jgi:hypothetical protein
MNRSPAVTVSAVIALIGSILTLLMGILMLVIMVIAPIPQSAAIPASPEFSKVLFAALSLIYILPAIWGIATSIGLFRLKNWARISMIVFSVLLILMAGFSGLISMLIPTPSSAGTHAPASIMVGVRIFMGVFWLSLLGVGIWWLVLFTRAGVQAQFAQRSIAMAGLPVPTGEPIQMLASASQPGSKRPLSITIIAWLMLVGCAFIPLSFFMKTPMVLFTRLITGWAAFALLAIYGLLTLFAGIGLLRLKSWGRTVAIALYVFGFLNGFVFYFAPGGHARAVSLMQTQRAVFPWLKTVPAEQQFDMPVQMFVVFAIIGLIGALVPVYFLVTRKAAFENQP